MIQLTCTNCKAVLDIDEAFAGGVCRCMYCGTIQTVPSHLKKKAAPTKPVHRQQAKALYKQAPARPETVSAASGLDELADVVASSGLGGSGLRSNAMPSSGLRSLRPVSGERLDLPAGIQPAPWWRHRALLLSVAAAACALLLILTLILTVTGSGSSQPDQLTDANGTPIVSHSSSPNFCGVPLNDRMVIYVLDRGSATGEMLTDLKEACYRSIETLGSDCKFQIIFWDNGTEESFPRAGPTFATQNNLEAARRALDSVSAFGQTEPAAALRRAFASNPGAIVLATAKAHELDEGFVDFVDQLRANNQTKVYTFALGSGDVGPALKTIARRSGGEYRALGKPHLREYGD